MATILPSKSPSYLLLEQLQRCHPQQRGRSVSPRGRRDSGRTDRGRSLRAGGNPDQAWLQRHLTVALLARRCRRDRRSSSAVAETADGALRLLVALAGVLAAPRGEGGKAGSVHPSVDTDGPRSSGRGPPAAARPAYRGRQAKPGTDTPAQPASAEWGSGSLQCGPEHLQQAGLPRREVIDPAGRFEELGARHAPGISAAGQRGPGSIRCARPRGFVTEGLRARR